LKFGWALSRNNLGVSQLAAATTASAAVSASASAAVRQDSACYKPSCLPSDTAQPLP